MFNLVVNRTSAKTDLMLYFLEAQQAAGGGGGLKFVGVHDISVRIWFVTERFSLPTLCGRQRVVANSPTPPMDRGFEI
jgi:hypothetical protein